MKQKIEKSDLEKKLTEALNPISPQKEFIVSLRDNLQKKALVVIEKPDYLLMILMVLSGLVGGVLILWLLQLFFNPKRKEE